MLCWLSSWSLSTCQHAWHTAQGTSYVRKQGWTDLNAKPVWPKKVIVASIEVELLKGLASSPPSRGPLDKLTEPQAPVYRPSPSWVIVRHEHTNGGVFQCPPQCRRVGAPSVCRVVTAVTVPERDYVCPTQHLVSEARSDPSMRQLWGTSRPSQ